MSETQDLVARFTRAGTLKPRRPNQVERSHSNFNHIRVRSFVLSGSPRKSNSCSARGVHILSGGRLHILGAERLENDDLLPDFL